MGQENVALVAFNRGLISRLALARTDIKRTAFSAQTMTNWMPRVLGSMMLRPGLGYIGAVTSAARMIPFVFATADTAILEFTNAAMRVWVNDALVTRLAVSSAVANGNFDSNLTSWTDNDDSGGVSAWVTGGYMGLTGNGTAFAIRDQTVVVALADQNVEHALRIVVQRGPVVLRVGSAVGLDNYITETELATGTHSLVFTPGVSFSIRFMSSLKRQVLVDSCNVEGAGVMSITSPYLAADLGKIRYDESADVVFIACEGYQQRRVERRAAHSWSVVGYQSNDGPFRNSNVGPITMTPGALSGNTTLTASKEYFKSTNVGSLFRLTSSGQQVTATATAQNTFTNAVLVEGVDSQRVFAYIISGLTASGSTVTLQRSLDSSSGPWTDVASWTTDQSNTFDDSLDNQIVWYRIGVKTGGYAAGTIVMTLTYSAGSTDGVCRVTGFTSSVVVDVEVMQDFGGTSATDDWVEGEWSDRRGWPTSIAFYEGRLWWSGKNGIWGSISDGFDSYDESVEGDSGPINRDVGSGPVDVVNWLLPVSRLIAGAQGAEFSCKSSSLDEPLTPTNFNIKPDSSQGSAAVGAVKIDKAGMFVQNGGTRVFQLSKDGQGGNGIDYDATDMTVLVPEIGEPSIVRMAVQRKPDTRIHCVRSDGVAAVAVFDRAENVLCWVEIEAREGDLIEDVVVLPGASGTGEDAVYYIVARVINGSTVRHLERWALESECRGGALNKQADAFLVYSGVAATSITAAHLAGETVVVWADGLDVGEHVISAGGALTLETEASNVVVGLPYTARWKSTKLAYAAQSGTALQQRKKFDHLGVILVDTHIGGLRYGPNFTDMDSLPLVENGVVQSEDTIYENYDEDSFEFQGEWGPDSRLCLEAAAPRPCNILAATLPIEEHWKR